jgi:hypothetical protein
MMEILKLKLQNLAKVKNFRFFGIKKVHTQFWNPREQLDKL